MATFAFVLAALAAFAAALLWCLDARQRRRRAQPAPRESAPDGPQPEQSEQLDPEPELTKAPTDAPATAVPVSDAEERREVKPVPEPFPEVTPEPEPALAPEPTPEPEQVPEPGPESGPAPVPVPEPAPEPEPEPEETGEPAENEDVDPDRSPSASRSTRAPRPHRASGLLPGSLRRERRAWAGENGFDFVRSDEYLNDEWTRGAAASGAAARDIVRGQAFGHEMVLMDLGGVNVMAVRRGGASDVVVDVRRDTFEDQQPSDDLLAVRAVGDFQIFATETGPAERLIDKRVTTALSALPAAVTAVWMESDWVLAQTAKGSHAGDWDAMLAPMALLADAARVLPPRPSVTQILHLEDLDPTRQMEPPADPVPTDRGRAGEAEPLARPLVVRPEEPLEMPTRVRAESRGVVEPRAIGADEVEAIADGEEPEQPGGFHGARMPRNLSRGPSIFGDETDR